MAAATETQLMHRKLLDQMDLHSVHKTFRSPSWRANHRRNKNIKTIMIEASRKEASSSTVATPLNVSGSTTPLPGRTASVPGDGKDDEFSTSCSSTPVSGSDVTRTGYHPNLVQASRGLSKLALEKNHSLRQCATAPTATGSPAPNVTYTNIESAPSLAHTRQYCDVTGLPAPYLDPKTRLRYHNKEVFSFIRSLPQGVAEQYLEARGAHVVLK